MRTYPPEPTAEQCSTNTRVEDFEKAPAYATWYPQMGGYVGKAVIVLIPADQYAVDNCFDVYVWHDGAFPFTEDGSGSPAHLHHCMPSQFVDFGWLVQHLQRRLPE